VTTLTHAHDDTRTIDAASHPLTDTHARLDLTPINN
jgi:hypothetical protein